ncbi:MAG: hypothetical protein ACFFAO_06140 [Candidatus Hermodarchaeota archaeon]
MFLYAISNEGDLIKVNKIDFQENEAYIVFDKYTIYVWLGLNVSQKKRMNAISLARKLNAEKEEAAKLLLMDQNREYGAFLAMMEQLRQGLDSNGTIEQRPELVLDIPIMNDESIQENQENEIELRIQKWLEQLKKHRKTEPDKILISNKEEEDLESQIEVAAFYLSLKSFSYSDLCWILAEKELLIQSKNTDKVDIRKLAEKIFHSSTTYDELCWLIAELDILVEMNYFDTA